jgi:hypothetical protein
MRGNVFNALCVCLVLGLFAPAQARQNATTPIPTSSTAASSAQTGYVRIVPSSGSGAPAGQAIFGLRTNGVLITEGAVPFTTPVQSGRIFAEISTTVNTALALANPSSQNVVVSFFCTDSYGVDSGAGSFTIPANQQVTAFMTNAPFSIASPFTGTLTFNSTAPVAAIGIRSFVNERNEVLLSTIPVSPIGSSNSGNTLLVPNLYGALTTQFVLVNPFDTPISGTISFYGQGSKNGSVFPIRAFVNGNSNYILNYTVAPRSAFRFAPQQSKTLLGSVRITPSATSSAPSSFAILSYSNKGFTVSMTSLNGVASSTALRTYTESSGIFGQIGSVRTALMILNPSATRVWAQMSLMNLDGTSTGFSNSVSIAAGGQTSKLITDLFPQLPSTFKGFLRVTTSSPIIVMATRDRYNERGDLLLTDTRPYNESTPPLAEIEFPIFVNGGGYSTQLVLLSTASSSQSGSLYLVVQDGTVLPSGSVQPGP